MAVKTTTQCSTYSSACCPNPSWWSLPKPRLYTGRNCFLMAAQFESHSGTRALLFWAREPGMRSSREAVIGRGRTSGVAFDRLWPRAGRTEPKICAKRCSWNIYTSPDISREGARVQNPSTPAVRIDFGCRGSWNTSDACTSRSHDFTTIDATWLEWLAKLSRPGTQFTV